MLEKTALVFGQMDEQPGTRLRVPLTALTMAEYFRDVQNQDVLLFKMCIRDSSWRAHANLLWRNWLNWVYQTTPYDLSEVPQLRAERRLGTDRSIRHAPCSPRDDQFLPFDTSGYGLK